MATQWVLPDDIARDRAIMQSQSLDPEDDRLAKPREFHVHARSSNVVCARATIAMCLKMNLNDIK